MKLVVFGLSLSSSWGNGHATTYRSLIKALATRGHRITFFERDVPWYADARDLAEPGYCRLVLYGSIKELSRHADTIASADAVIVGSYVPEGPRLLDWLVTREREPRLLAFYDIDTPVTVAKLGNGDEEYLRVGDVPLFDLYFSFSAGPIMRRIEAEFGARDVRHLGCCADTDLYRPSYRVKRWALGYLGTYDESRQPMLERLLIEPARQRPDLRFAVAGPKYPETLGWPANVDRIEHLPPHRHAGFYSALHLALSVTRSDMVRAGYSPSVRIFEAASCATPVVTDWWPGLDHFFEPGSEILTASSAGDILALLDRTDAHLPIGQAGRRRVMRDHSAARRSEQLEAMLREGLLAGLAPAPQPVAS